MILFHVQHLLGSGHVQRIRQIAAELALRGVPVTVVSGGMPVPAPPPEGVEWIQLEPVRSASMNFDALVDAAGRPADAALFERRQAAVEAIYERLRPRVLVIESYPFGRRAFRGEIEALLRRVRGGIRPALAAASIRDILHRRSDQREAESAARINRHFDAVLVHGDPSVIALEASFGACEAIAQKLVYTGYVAPPPVPRNPVEIHGRGDVVVSAGGGAAGMRLYETAIEAAIDGRVRRPWRLLVGAGVDDDAFDALKRRAGGAARIERNRGDFREVLADAAVLVSQAGYNTIADVLVTGVPSLLVPFQGSGETEQLQRARCFQTLGRCHCLRESELDARALAARLDEVLSAPEPMLPDMNLDGIDFCADWLAARA